METKGTDGIVVCEYENGRDGVERNSDEGKRGPDDEHEEGCSPDDEEERVCEEFGGSGGER